MSDKIPISERLQHGWNAFRNKDPSVFEYNPFTVSVSSDRPDSRKHRRSSIDTTMINSIFTRISIDAASASFEHIKIDSNGGYLSTVKSGLNNILTLEANIDQSAQEFLLDVIMSLLDEGVVACVPIDTDSNSGSDFSGYDIITMRTGKIVNWYPDRIAVEVYNDRIGSKETITVLKSKTAIITNPFYSIMNEPNSTLRRLNRRLALLDAADDRVGSPKLDMVIQLPYSIKNELRTNQAEKRRNEIITQLRESEYGIAYVDGTEKIVQLNRSIENNLTANIEYLTTLLFNQLGLSPEVLNMTASEQTMTNYYRRIIDPINDAIVNEFKRKFLTKTARTQGQTVWHHSEPFKFTPTSALAEIADKLTRNEILTSNEFRGIIGYKPSDDPRANQLENPNIPQQSTTEVVDVEQPTSGLGSVPMADLVKSV